MTGRRANLLRLWGMILIGCVALTGCGGSREKEGAKEIKYDANRRIILTVNKGPMETEKNEIERARLLVEMFEKKHPDIHVVMESWVFTPETFAVRAAANQLTDLVDTWATEGETLLNNNLVSDMTPLLTAWRDFNDLHPIILKPFERDGHYYAFPISAYSMGLYYNKSLFRKAGITDAKGEAKPPETWEEFLATAKRLTDRKSGVCGFAILGGDHSRAGWHFLNWGWQGGGEFMVKEDGRWRAVLNGPGVVRALQFVKDLRWKYGVLQENVLDDQEDIMQAFAAGRVGMFIEPANEGGVVKLREKYGFNLTDLGIAPLPAGPGGSFVQMGADYLVFRPGISDEMKKVAFRWCEFLVSNEWKEAEWQLRRRQGLPVGAPYIPIFRGERQRQWDAILENYRTIPRFAEYGSVVDYLKTEPPYYCQQLYKEVLGPAVQEVLTNEKSDPAAILGKSAEIFQRRYLDRIK